MKITENSQFSTYVESDDMKQRLLSYEWIVIKNTWTNCPQSIYNKIKNDFTIDYFLGKNPKYNSRNQKDLRSN
tara:strand:- start:795 stop:1013 length:219 start_codon:yes stop_codon:yes gene_type:complete